MNNTLVYQIITDRIISKLEQGIIPWKKEWTSSRPCNLVTKQPYHGINYLMTKSAGYSSSYWLSFNQCKSLKGHVLQGEKGTPIIFWKMWSPTLRQEVNATDDTPDKNGLIPLLKYSTVFNLQQTTVQAKDIETHEHKPIEEAEAIIQGYTNKPEIVLEGDRACYSPTTDKIYMPKPESFTSPEAYYSTLFHEMTHSTGVQKRLKRYQDNETVSFGSESYSNEELIAELGACFLASDCGIGEQVLDNSTAYIGGWLKRLKNDNKLIIQASSKATKSCNHIRQVAY